MERDDRNQLYFVKPRETVNLGYLLAKGWATSIWPFFRHDCGSQALAAPGVIAFLIIVFYAAGQNAPEMLDYLYVWLCLMVVHRVRARKRERDGTGEHSRFDGYSLAMRLPLVGTDSRAKGIEPFLCFGVAICLLPWSQALGGFWMLGAFALLVVRVMELKAREAQWRAARDAAIEMRQQAERLRGIRRDF